MNKYTAEEEQALLEEILDEEATIREILEEEEQERLEYERRMHRAYARMAYSEGDEQYEDPYDEPGPYEHVYGGGVSGHSAFDDPTLPF